MTTFGDMVYGLGGIPLLGAAGSNQPNVIGAKTVYFVDGNYGSDSNSGKNGWADAFKTLTVALAASHADTASGAEGWAARNVIFCKGDTFTEDLVLLAQKTDVVGVGSYNANHKPGLVGNHVPTGATASYGTRFFNMYFQAPAAGGDIWTLDSLVSNIEFHGCTFNAASTTAATAAIINTASPFMGLFGNRFLGPFSDAVIEFGAGAGFRGCQIVGNYIEGGEDGIELASGTTATVAGAGASLVEGIIKDNVIVTVGLCIDDDADIAYIIGNRCYSDAAKGTTGFGIIDGLLAKGQDNRITGSDVNNAVWPAEGSL